MLRKSIAQNFLRQFPAYIINNYIFICHTYFVEIGEVTTTGSPKKAEKVLTPVKPFEGKEGKIYLLFGRSFFENIYILI